MKIQQSKETSTARDLLGKAKSKLRFSTLVKYTLLSALGVVVVAGFIFWGIQLRKHHEQTLGDIKYNTRDVIYDVLETNIDLIPNFFNSILEEPETVYLDIKHKNIQKLAYKRFQAIEKGHLSASSDDYVKAQLKFHGKKTKVKLRLKGDAVDHLQGDKWSYRVKVRGDDAFMGMKVFSLHKPEARNYMYEWFFHKLLQYEDLIGLRYKFIRVIQNGKDMGIYALEEHFEKRLIENNQRKEGPILKFTESNFWHEWRLQKENYKRVSIPNSYGSYQSSTLSPFRTKRTMQNPKLKAYFLAGVNQLNKFRTGQLPIKEVFDQDRLAKYYALIDLIKAGHGSAWNNERFYFNPTTMLLEPIGFDGFGGGISRPLPLTSLLSYIGGSFNSKRLNVKDPKWGDYFAQIFNDPEFYKTYIGYLDKFSQPGYFARVGEVLKEELAYNLNVVRKDYLFFNFSTKFATKNAKIVQTLLHPKQAINCFVTQTKKQLHLNIANIQHLAVQLKHIEYQGTILHKFPNPTFLDAKTDQENPQYTDFTIPTTDSLALADLNVVYSIWGMANNQKLTPNPWQAENGAVSTEINAMRAPNFAHFRALAMNHTNKVAYLKKGHYTLNQNLVLPHGYRFEVEAGTKIDLTQDAKIVCYGNILFKGTEKHPITLTSSDHTGQGLVVLQAAATSQLEQVKFEYLSAPQGVFWHLTSAVCFYEADVLMQHCNFYHNIHGDDYLNIVRGEFALKDLIFKKVKADAIDCDFANGKVENIVFEDIGNDAIDISGTEMVGHSIRMQGVQDKGLSAGENSRMAFRNVQISQAEIAVTGKDKSIVQVTDLKITNSSVGIAAYQKKPEFGSSQIYITGLELEKVRQKHLIEKGSSLEVDGSLIRGTEKKIEKLFYGNQYGKKSVR